MLPKIVLFLVVIAIGSVGLTLADERLGITDRLSDIPRVNRIAHGVLYVLWGAVIATVMFW